MSCNFIIKKTNNFISVDGIRAENYRDVSKIKEHIISKKIPFTSNIHEYNISANNVFSSLLVINKWKTAYIEKVIGEDLRYIKYFRSGDIYDGDIYVEKYVNNYFSMQKTISRTKEDGLQNIIPFIILFRRTPKSLRKILGKGTWKKIHKNSFTKNKNIVSTCYDTVPFFSTTVKKKIQCIRVLVNHNHFPKNTNIRGDILIHCVKCIDYTPKAIPFKKKQEMSGIISDLYSMKKQYFPHFKINPNWKYRKIKEEHDALSDLLAIKEINIDGIGANQVFPNQKRFESFIENTKNITNLNTIELFKNESKKMRHCIASYAKKSYEGTYLAFHIEDDKGNHATAGFNVQEPFIKLDQIKSYRNNKPSLGCKKIVKLIEKRLTEQ